MPGLRQRGRGPHGSPASFDRAYLTMTPVDLMANARPQLPHRGPGSGGGSRPRAPVLDTAHGASGRRTTGLVSSIGVEVPDSQSRPTLCWPAQAPPSPERVGQHLSVVRQPASLTSQDFRLWSSPGCGRRPGGIMSRHEVMGVRAAHADWAGRLCCVTRGMAQGDRRGRGSLGYGR